MTRRLGPVLARVAVCAVSAAPLVLTSASPALAFGQETFGCRIAPGSEFTFATYCDNSTNPSATTYTVGFLLDNRSGSYTYSWSISGPYQSIHPGYCTATTADCGVVVQRGVEPKEIVATVTYTQDGQTLSKTAYGYVY